MHKEKKRDSKKKCNKKKKLNYSCLHMFVRITNQHMFGASVCLILVTPISRQPLPQFTNGLLHLGCIISEQHPIPI